MGLISLYQKRGNGKKSLLRMRFRVMKFVIGSDAQVKNLITTCINTNLTHLKNVKKAEIVLQQLELKERFVGKHQSV
jgi:hypothetical protein